MNRAIALAIIGLLTGMVETYLVRTDEGSWLKLLGLMFGIPVALLLRSQGMLASRVPVIVAGFWLSWLAAYWSAVNAGARVEAWGEIALYGIAGLVGGFVGIVILLIVFRITLGPPRFLNAMVLTVAVGTVAGLILIEVAFLEHPMNIFILWQAAVGAALGWAWPQQENAAYR